MLHLLLFQATMEAQTPWKSHWSHIVLPSYLTLIIHLLSQNPWLKNPVLSRFPITSKPNRKKFTNCLPKLYFLSFYPYKTYAHTSRRASGFTALTSFTHHDFLHSSVHEGRRASTGIEAYIKELQFIKKIKIKKKKVKSKM